MALTRDKNHDDMREKINDMAKKCKSANEFIKVLKAENIQFKDSTINGGKSIQINTGCAGYDIVGIEVFYQKSQYVIRDILN